MKWNRKLLYSFVDEKQYFQLFVQWVWWHCETEINSWKVLYCENEGYIDEKAEQVLSVIKNRRTNHRKPTDSCTDRSRTKNKHRSEKCSILRCVFGNGEKKARTAATIAKCLHFKIDVFYIKADRVINTPKFYRVFSWYTLSLGCELEH